MPKYVLSVLVKPKLKNLLSVLRYRLHRFRSKGQNQQKTISNTNSNSNSISVKGARRRGRQKKRWEDNIKEWTGMGFGDS